MHCNILFAKYDNKHPVEIGEDVTFNGWISGSCGSVPRKMIWINEKRILKIVDYRDLVQN